MLAYFVNHLPVAFWDQPRMYSTFKKKDMSRGIPRSTSHHASDRMRSPEITRDRLRSPEIA